MASITEEYIPPSKGSFLSLLIALIALSCAAIFIKLSEREIGPVAIVLRVWHWISTSIIQSPEQKHDQRPPEKREVLLLVLVGIMGTASVVFWAVFWTMYFSSSTQAVFL